MWLWSLLVLSTRTPLKLVSVFPPSSTIDRSRHLEIGCRRLGCESATILLVVVLSSTRSWPPLTCNLSMLRHLGTGSIFTRTPATDNSSNVKFYLFYSRLDTRLDAVVRYPPTWFYRRNEHLLVVYYLFISSNFTETRET